VGVACNKRDPGSGCPAIGGLTRQHAILGASAHCIATHPSDMCVALAALDATIHVQSKAGARTIAFADLHRLPGDTPQHDTVLQADDLITAIGLPPAAQFAAHSSYLKIRERASYAFALVSVAAAIDVDRASSAPTVRSVRVALGSVAHKAWRLPAAEALLAGRPATLENFALLADALLDGASGQGENGFKIPMARRAILRALEQALAGTIDNTGSAGSAGRAGNRETL
jgi:xanthine dehydrogenase YagS FAD-binding subunit